MSTEQQYPGWTKDPDGVWRNPRYPKGSKSQKDGLSLVYDDELNGAVITVDGHSSPLSFWELSNFLDQAQEIRKAVQGENSRLWKEKEEIMRVEDGVEPGIYQRGRRMNPTRRK